MGLEAATFIAQLVATNPEGSDDASTADDHLRLIKQVLQSQFPQLGNAAVSATADELNIMDGVTATTANLNETSTLADDLATKAPISHFHTAGDINAGTMINERISVGNVTQHEGSINHDALANYVAAEHIDWSVAGAEDIQIGRINQGQISIGNLNGYDPNRFYDHSTISINTGAFLSGGGTIQATRTINFDFTGAVADAGIDPLDDADKFLTQSASIGLALRSWGDLKADVLGDVVVPNKTFVSTGSGGTFTPSNQIVYYVGAGATFTLNATGVALGTEMTIVNSNAGAITLSAPGAGIQGTSTIPAGARMVVTRTSTSNLSTYWHCG